MATIIQREDPILRKKAMPVVLADIKSAKIKKIISDMRKTLASQDDGVAIAAPQIGISLRIFVISGKVFDMIKPDMMEEKNKKAKDVVCINPKIVKISKDKKVVEEGCLSVRYLYGKTNRSTKARIRAYDEKGVSFELGGSGLLAQIFQHETDHLDGILFTDHAVDLHDVPPIKQK
jgi:peptide deformylase